MKTLSIITIIAAVLVIGCNVEANTQKDEISLIDYWPAYFMVPFILIAWYSLITIKNGKR